MSYIHTGTLRPRSRVFATRRTRCGTFVRARRDVYICIADAVTPERAYFDFSHDTYILLYIIIQVYYNVIKIKCSRRLH